MEITCAAFERTLGDYQHMKAEVVSGHSPWQQGIPVAELAHDRGRATARNAPTNKLRVDLRYGVEGSIGWVLA